MDKSWINSPRNSTEYDVGANHFMKFAIKNAENKEVIRCPCVKCRNFICASPAKVTDHLFVNGFDKNYNVWFWHGEEVKSSQGVDDQLDVQTNDLVDDNTIDMVYLNCGSNKGFVDMLEDAQKPLYPGCQNFTKLSALVKLFNIKGKYGWSDGSFTELLELLSLLMPNGNDLPSTIYEAKRLVNTSKGQFVFMVYNPSHHWVLVVIDVSTMRVFYLDPMINGLPDPDLKELINVSMTIFACEDGKKWVYETMVSNVKVPRQPGTNECGYYVMRFIRDIMEDINVLQNNFNGKQVYLQSEIDEVRDEWALGITSLIEDGTI